MDLNNSLNHSPEDKGKLMVKCFGLGDAGCRIVEFLAEAGFPEMSFTAINSDAQSLAQCNLAQKFQIGAQISRGLSMGGDPEQAHSAADQDAAELGRLCAGADLVLLFTSLSGGAGAGASPVLARVARETSALVLAFGILPFDCEGKVRQAQAQRMLQLLQRTADGVICLSNQKLTRLVSEKESLMETFRLSHELLAQGLHGIWRLLTRPGLIRLDFAHLAKALRGRHSESAFAVAEASGPERASEVVSKLLAHPLLDQGQLLGSSQTVLLSIAAGPDLAIGEINRIVETINQHTTQADMILGTSLDDSLGDRLAVTLITAAGQSALQPENPPAREMRGEPASSSASFDLETQLLSQSDPTPRPRPRYLPPPPELSVAQAAELYQKQTDGTSRLRKVLPRLRQAQLPFDIISKGRFEKSEPTIRRGEDLDVPTFKRRGIQLS